MPKKDIRQIIEADLTAEPLSKLLVIFDALKREVIELDNALMRAEAIIGDPAQWRHDGVPERMRRVGVPEEVIARYERLLRWLVAMSSGGPIPPDFLRAAEEYRALCASVADELARIAKESGPKT